MEVVDGAREEDVELWKGTLDDDAFTKLSEADIGYATHVAASSMGLEPNQRQEQLATQRPRKNGATTTQRFKRKNFSKQLQLLCLQQYAQYARDFGRLPDKYETQQLLQQSYLQFLKEGGTADEPKLTHAEFLKLIRNRRREIHARAQRPPKQNKDDHITAKMAGLTPAKRKLQEEHAKIQELIQVIDRAREQAGLISDSQPQQRRPKLLLAGVEKRHAQQQPTTVEMVMVSPPSTIYNLTSLHVPADPMELMETILQIHVETRDVQREIVARLRSINCVISQHGGHGEMEEPSSVSV
ncbi:hypothetical protein KXD40_000850 [Peronospora effusa]|nr:hypothetical protein KXD40_000850 [Peronospora effusa]